MIITKGSSIICLTINEIKANIFNIVQMNEMTFYSVLHSFILGEESIIYFIHNKPTQMAV